ncbi:RSP_7527 family protein [Bradyrhizobium neotropicale]|uniref:RSP_7527 family protein n=1 Tax=Bradyrhizobium neotropicale TaxID=1497615 RepID=UPI00390820EF
MKLTRRAPPRRVTPELLAFHIKQAHALRAEAYRDMMRALWARLLRITHKRC